MTFGVAVARRDKPIYGFQEKGPAISNPICRDALKVVFDHLSLRETALTSRVSPSWHQTGKDAFHDRVTLLRSGFEQPQESESQTLQALDLEKSPKEIKKDLPSKAVQALDPAKSHQRKPKADKLSDVEFVRTKVQPDLKSAVEKICEQIKKLGLDQKLVFRVHSPHMSGFRFEGDVWMGNSSGLHREVDLVLEKKEETRQPLSDFSRDLKAMNKLIKKTRFDQLSPNCVNKSYPKANLSSTILPSAARLPVQRIQAFFKSEEGKSILEIYQKNKPLDLEQITASVSIFSELQRLMELNKKDLQSLQNQLCQVAHKRNSQLLDIHTATNPDNYQQVAPQATSLLSALRTRFEVFLASHISPENFEQRAIENRLLILSFVLGVASLVSEVVSLSPSPEFIIPFVVGMVYYQIRKDVHYELSVSDKYRLISLIAGVTIAAIGGDHLASLIKENWYLFSQE